MRRLSILAAPALLAAGLAADPVRAEVIEEVVAWVNGDIITKSELEGEEQAMVAEAYRRFAGAELDRKVREMRAELLMQMIDRKILLQQAVRMFDRDKMAEAFYDMFKQQQGIKDDAEIERLVAREGMTVADLKERLVESFAPDEVLRYEVGSRIAVGDREVERYYNEHTSEFEVPVEVALSEIVLLAATPEGRAARKDELESVVRRVEAGEAFADVARELSESGTREADGKLGTFKRGDLAPDLERVAFALEPGDVSEPIETDYGWQILRVDARSGGNVRTLEEVREPLRERLEDTKYLAELRQFLDKNREQSDWCVKKSYRDRLPDGVAEQPCKNM